MGSRFMTLLLYGMGLVGKRDFTKLSGIRKRIKEVKNKNPEWKHYEIVNSKGRIVEQGTLIDWGFNPKEL